MFSLSPAVGADETPAENLDYLGHWKRLDDGNPDAALIRSDFALFWASVQTIIWAGDGAVTANTACRLPLTCNNHFPGRAPGCWRSLDGRW